MKKKYRVYFTESNTGWLDVEASNEAEAEEIANDDIDSIEWAEDSRHEVEIDSVEEKKDED